MAWTLDTTHSHVGFAVKHLMISTVRGQFKTFSGDVQLDPQDFTKSVIRGEVDVTSVDTGNADRDAHLRNNDFFDAQTHPKMTFVSEQIVRKGDDYEVKGALTLRGVSKEVTFAVEVNGPAKSPYGQTVIGINASASINRKDFGVHFNAVLETGGVAVSDTVKILIEAELVEQPAA